MGRQKKITRSLKSLETIEVWMVVTRAIYQTVRVITEVLQRGSVASAVEPCGNIAAQVFGSRTGADVWQQ